MTPTEKDLFKAVSTGIMFRLGFQSLLTAAARQKGSEALAWLEEFECRVIADAHRMRAHKPIPRRIVHETVDGVVSEFQRVFSDVRHQIEADLVPPPNPPQSAPKADTSRRQIKAILGYERYRRV